MSERTYRNAKQELVDKGYAVLIKKDFYKFYEFPYGKNPYETKKEEPKKMTAFDF